LGQRDIWPDAASSGDAASSAETKTPSKKGDEY